MLLDLPGVLPILVMQSGLRTNIDTLAVFAHSEVCLRLSQICSDEVRIALDSLVAILNRGWKFEEFDEAGSTVRVSSRVFGRPLDHLRVCLNCSGPVCLLEFGITKFASLLCLFWADVGFLLGCDLGLLRCTKLSKDFGRAVFCLRLLVVENGVSEITQLLVGGADARKCSD